jgi:two-component system sensor histidine kinase UhpB
MLLRRLRGLRAQFLLWTILPLAAALTIFSIAGIARHRQAMSDLVAERDRSLTLASASRLSREIDRRVTELALAAASPDLTGDPGRVSDLAAAMKAEYPGGMTLLDAAGEPAGGELAPEWAVHDETRVVAARTIAVGRPQFEGLTADSPDSGHILLVAAPAGQQRALVGAIPVETLPLADTGELAGMDHTGNLYIFDGTGRQIHHGVHDDSAPDAKLLSNLAPAPPGGAGATTLRTPEGQQLVVTLPCRTTGLDLVAGRPATMAAMGLSFVEILPAVLLFVALLGLLAVSFGVANVVHPLQELDRRAARLAWGDFDAVSEPVGGVQEMEDLRATLKQMADRIRAYQTGMRDYLSAVTQAQEDERARLARELHDDTVQSLIALKQRAQMARRSLGHDPQRAVARLEELESLIDEELGALRQLIGNLRPMYLEDLGFVPAVEMLAQQMQDQTGISVAVTVDGEVARLPPDMEVAAYRIIQQALDNVAAHAHAEHARIEISFREDSLRITVQDDGVGFTPPEQPADLARRGHFGLMGMHERALLYGGSLVIASAPGAGATIEARLPRPD